MNVRSKNSKVRIGVNSRMYQQTNIGIPYYIKCLYEKLITSHAEYDYVFFQTDTNKTIGPTCVFNGPKTGIYGGLFDLLFVLFLIKKERINIFHGPSNILPLFKLKNVRYILTVHDLSFLFFPNNHSKLFQIYYKYGLKISLKNADEIIAVSNNTKNDIIKYFNINKDKIKVIYPGVNSTLLEYKEEQRLVSNKYFFSITTHPVRKNILSIIKLLAIKPDLKKYVYVVAGLFESTQLEILKDLINKYKLEDNVIIWGYATEQELVNLYKNSEFFIYPSFYEGFGFPIVEAMSCKTLVITSNNSSMKELLPNKDYLVDPYNIDDIYSKMRYALDRTPAERNADIESNYIFSSRFNWTSTANKFIRLSQQL
jgi:glycosyltransferase involved in cell wall biosynthesis